MIPDISLGKKKEYSQKTIEGTNKLVSSFNDIIKIRKGLVNKTKFTDDLLLGLESPSDSSIWSDYFEDLYPLNYENSFFEKIGNLVLSNQLAKDFWIKFIKNRFHESFNMF